MVRGCWAEALACPTAIIFLDIDGVLVPSTTRSDSFGGSSQLKCFSSIIQVTKAQIVLSSNWRLSPAHSILVCEIFERAGLRRPIGATLDLSREHKTREHEITEWIKQNSEFIHGNAWITIDDMLLSGLSPEHKVTPDKRIGLTDALANDAIAKIQRLQAMARASQRPLIIKRADLVPELLPKRSSTGAKRSDNWRSCGGCVGMEKVCPDDAENCDQVETLSLVRSLNV